MILLTILGFFFLGMGAIGLLLPVWPTTPFVLLAVACFSGTPRIKEKILKVKFFREHVENYETRRGLSRRTFWMSMVWLWGMLLLSMVMMQKITMTFFLSLIGIAVTIHIAWMSRSRVRGGVEEEKE